MLKLLLLKNYVEGERAGFLLGTCLEFFYRLVFYLLFKNDKLSRIIVIRDAV